MLTILYLLVNNKALMMFVGCTYEFTNDMTTPYLMYWTYAQMYVCFR